MIQENIDEPCRTGRKYTRDDNCSWLCLTVRAPVCVGPDPSKQALNVEQQEAEEEPWNLRGTDKMIRLSQLVSKHQKQYKVVQERYGYTKETVQKAHNLLKSYAKHNQS